MTNPLSITEVLSQDDNAGMSLHHENDIYTIEESIRTLLELAFALKKATDNKTCKIWETKFKVPESNATKML